MVLVDSSVWIDYLAFETSQVAPKLEALIRPNNQVLITGIILQEILQGIRNEKSYQLTVKFLKRLPAIMPNVGTHLAAARMFRKLLVHGKRPSTVDVLIAALAVENKAPLFTLDLGFRSIELYSNLTLFA